MSRAADEIEKGCVVWVLGAGATEPVEMIWSEYAKPPALVTMTEHIRLRGEERRRNREYYAAHPNELLMKKRGNRLGRGDRFGTSFVR